MISILVLHPCSRVLWTSCKQLALLSFLQAERSNKRHRPIGIGVQGLADAFILMRYPFESPEAQLLNIQIFETIYYAALEASCELASELGPYETYPGSPVSKGVSRFHSLKALLGHILAVWEQQTNKEICIPDPSVWHVE